MIRNKTQQEECSGIGSCESSTLKRKKITQMPGAQAMKALAALPEDPGFDCQHSHCSSQTSVTAVAGDAVSTSGFAVTRYVHCVHTYTQAKHPHM